MGCPGGMSTIRSGLLSIRNMIFHCIFLILGDPGASGFWLVAEKRKFSGTNQKPERRRPFGTGLVRHCPQGLFSPFFTFLRAIFFRPFRLSRVPTICPWVSEDVACQECNAYWSCSHHYLLRFPLRHVLCGGSVLNVKMKNWKTLIP